MPESVQSCFELSIHLSVSEPAVNCSKNSSRGKKIQWNVRKVQNTTGRFLAQLHPSKFLLKILFLVPKVSNSRIFQKRCFLKIIWHPISVQTLLFRACLPTRQNGVENRDKAYYVDFTWSICYPERIGSYNLQGQCLLVFSNSIKDGPY